MNLQNWVLELSSNYETATDRLSHLSLTPSVLRRRKTAPGTANGLILYLPHGTGHLARRHAPPPCASTIADVAARRRLPPAPARPNRPPPKHCLLRHEA